jgi:hypothetical protein
MRLRQLLSSLNRPRARQAGPRAKRPVRLRLEVLEDRSVPSILFSNTGSRTVADAGGPVITNAHVDLIFWGSGWNTGGGPAYRTQITSSVDTIMRSPYLSGLYQYRNVGNGTLAFTHLFTDTSPGSTFTDAQIDNLVRTNINNGRLPGPGTSGGQILYMVIPQPGSTTGTSVGGEHGTDTSNPGRFHYGWSINPNTSSLDTVTNIYSHELTEAVTDPEVNFRTAFYVPSTNDEICDGEAQNYSYRLNGVLVQSSLSQASRTYNVYDGQAQNFLVSSGRALTVNGDQLANHNDIISIDTSGGGMRVTLNGEVAQFDPGTINSVTVNSGTGSDVINVFRTLPGVPLTVNSSGSASVNIGVGGSVQGIQGPVTVYNGPSYDRLTVDDSADTGDRSATISSGGITGLAPAAINFTSYSVSNLTVTGGTGANTFTVTGTPAATLTTIHPGGATFPMVEVVNVRATTLPLRVVGDTPAYDVVNVGDAGSVQNIRGAVTVTSAVGRSQLNADDSADPAGRAVTVSDSALVGLAPAPLYYPGDCMDLLTAWGGRGVNTFTVTNTPLFPYANEVMSLHPGGGALETVIVGGTTGPLNIIGAGQTYDVVNVGNAGSVQGVRGAVTITGWPNDTQLNVDDSADPVARNATISASAITGLAPAAITYQGDALAGLQVLGGSGGNTFPVVSSPPAGIGLDAGGGANTLVGSNAGNLWALAGVNAGTLSGAAYAGPVGFSRAQSLTAGSGGDTFQFADGATLSGTLTGGGADTLDDSAYSTSVVVDLQTGQATGVGRSVGGIGTVYGGTGNGSLGAYNLLIGNGGNVLVGGTGRRNLLVAGASASALYGSDQDDLLIGGTTAYDTEAGLASWLRIAAEWAGPDDYATRVSKLITPGSGVPLLDATTVTGNGGGNTLMGNGALALLYTDGADAIAGFDPASQVVPITP